MENHHRTPESLPAADTTSIPDTMHHGEMKKKNVSSRRGGSARNIQESYQGMNERED